MKAVFQSARFWSTRERSWVAATTDGFSRAVPFSTAKWMRSSAPASGAILLYGIPQVIVGENRTFRGDEDLLRSRGVRVQVLQDERCVRLMQEFIAAYPELWNEDIGR
jgi:hypothetical protein